jgi:mono/diheme cytochrome c family protein
MNHFIPRYAAPLYVLVGFLACSTVLAAGSPDMASGHALASTRCGGCHAVDRTGESPLSTAPPFRTLARKYPLESLEEALAEGIFAGHPDMPDDPWEPDDIRRLIAYLKVIQAP